MTYRQENQNMAYCNTCGTEVDPDAEFCSDCGEPLGESDSGGSNTENSGSFGATARKALSIVFVLIGLLIGLGGLNSLYNFILFQDSWSLSMTISYAIFVLIFIGIAKFIYPD